MTKTSPEPAELMAGLGAALEAAGMVGVYEWRPADDALLWSPGLLRIFGLTRTPTGEGGFSRLVHPDDRVRVEADTTGFLSLGANAYSHVFRIMRGDGAVRVILDRAAITRDGWGRVQVIRGLNVDVTDLFERPIAVSPSTGSEAILELALRAANAGASEWELGAERARWRGETFALFGFPPHEAEPTFEQWLERVHPQDRNRVMHAALTAAETAGSSLFSCEYRFLHSERGLRWILTQGRAERTTDERVGRQVMLSIDVTERKSAQAALELSERRYRALVQASADVVYRMTAGWCEVSRLPESDPSNEDAQTRSAWLSSCVHLDDHARVIAAIENAVASKAGFHIEHRAPCADGGVRWTEFRANPVFGPEGEVWEWVGAATDISERKAAHAQHAADQQRIAEQFAELEALYAEAPLGLGLLDHELRFVRINAALADMNGFSVEAHLGRTVWDLLPSLRETAEPALHRVLETGEAVRDVAVKGETPARPGVEREWLEHFYPLRAANGALCGVGIVCEEITTRVAAERALSVSEGRLAAAVRAGRVGVHEFDPRSGAIQWDSTIREIWGASADEPVTFETFAEGLHPEDAAATLAAVEEAFDPDGPGRFEAVYRVVHRRSKDIRWVRADGEVTFEKRSPVRLVGTAKDITERKWAEAALLAAHETFRHLVERSPFGVYTVDADLRVAHVSGGAQAMFRDVRPVIGRDFAEVARLVWSEPFASAAVDRFRHTLATGEPFHAPNSEATRADTGGMEAWDWRLERLTMPDGRPGVVCHFYDLSERQAHQRQIEMLMREVNHRSKNMLSLVQAVAQQTASTTPKDFVDRFSRRLQALAASQDLLVQAEWKSADLAALIESQLLHFGDLLGGRIRLEGPNVSVSPRAAQSLGMAFHELATNAAKYGALSGHAGSVHLSWRILGLDGDAELEIAWIETDGPPVKQPARKGFGHKLAKGLLESALSGTVALEYRPEGVQWRFRSKLSAVSETAAEKVPVQERPRERVGNNAVLVVEDEALLAFELAEALRAAGYHVVGPAASVRSALALLAHCEPFFAILDINLGAETSEPIAQCLRERAVPFVSVSGYSPSQHPPSFKECPSFLKPIDMPLLLQQVQRAQG